MYTLRKQYYEYCIQKIISYEKEAKKENLYMVIITILINRLVMQT